MAKLVEILLCTLKPGTGGEFHAIMEGVSVPLHRSAGIDVVAFGRSLHDADCYHLIRAFADLQHLEASQAAFYNSDAWRNGPRADIIACIATSLKSVMPLSAEAVEAMRRRAPTACRVSTNRQTSRQRFVLSAQCVRLSADRQLAYVKIRRRLSWGWGCSVDQRQ